MVAQVLGSGSWRRQWHPTPVLLPGKSHGWRSLEGCSPCGCWGSDITEQLHFHFSLSCIGRRKWHPTPVLLPGECHGQRSLVGFSPWGCTESDTTERLHYHFSLSCIGEGNGNPLQCSCLENPRDRGAWWAAVYGVAQSWTRLKRLSSSSSGSQDVAKRELTCTIGGNVSCCRHYGKQYGDHSKN